MATKEFSQLARRGENGFWRYAISLPLVLFLFLVVGGLFFYPVVTLAEIDGDPNTYLDGQTLEVVGYPVTDFVFLMLSFSTIWVGLYVAMRFVHRRPFLTLVTPRGRVSWRRVAQGFAISLALSVPVFGVQYLLDPSGFDLVFDARRFFLFIPVVLVLVPIQSWAEELLVRGYVLQGLGLLTENALVLSVVTGLLFALPHLPNPEMPAFGDGFVPAFLTFVVVGVFLALVTLKDNGLELALGLHAANNVFAFLTVNLREYPDTPSVFVTSAADLDPMSGLIGTVVAFAAFWVLAFRVFGRRWESAGAIARGEGTA